MAKATFAAIAIVVLATRLCHVDIVWVEEAYGMAAAAELLRGKLLYRDIWFDKPPLYAYFYTLIGAHSGLPLRLLGAGFVLACCWLAARFNCGPRWLAPALLAFFLTFALPSASIALAPDLLMLAPHLGAVWLASRQRPLASGLVAGIALLVNAKAIFVLAACAIWTWRAWPRLLAGFVAPALVALAVLPREWIEQVWVWGAAYSRDSFVENPAIEALRRTANWAGFHSALLVIALWNRDRRLWLWAAIAFVGVFPGLRFFPRYYFILLPPLVMLAASGWPRMPRAARVAALALLLIPLVRFGPRYAQLALGDRSWSDIAMSEDSRTAGEWLRSNSRPGDRLFVWGYRPDIFVYSGLLAGTKYLDSQPLSGVFADRHLFDSRPSVTPKPLPPLPELVVDGLGPYNPALALSKFASLEGYSVVCRTPGTVIYGSTQAGASRETR
jgi:hypothetical protein